MYAWTGAGGAAAEVTWQKYSGVRRSKFMPERDEKSTIVSSATSISDREVSDSRRESRLSVAIYDKEKDRDREIDIEKTVDKRPRRSEMWTEITKDLVIRDAIDQMGYEYEETEYFFYIMTYLRYVSAPWPCAARVTQLTGIIGGCPSARSAFRCGSPSPQGPHHRDSMGARIPGRVGSRVPYPLPFSSSR